MMQNGNSPQMKLFRDWFNVADREGTGMVTGLDAVQFFSRAGLHKKVLAQVWELSDVHNRGVLSFEEFVTALRLIAFAQMALSKERNLPEGSLFDVQQAKMALANPGFPGVPLLQGMNNPPLAQGAGVGVGVGVGAAVSQPNPQQQPISATTTAPLQGQGVMGMGGMGMISPGSVSASSYLSPQEEAKFKQAFLALDTDKDGYVGGGECFPVFMKSGLDKSVLKHIWDLVAGNEGKLNEQQFLLSQHFIMLSLKGEKLPTSLKPTPQASAPAPVQGQGALAPQSNANHLNASFQGMPQPTDAATATTGMMHQPPPPQLVNQQMPNIGTLPNPSLVSPVTGQFQYAPGTPPMPPNLDSVSYDEKRKLEEANERARKADQDRQKAAFDLQLANQNKDLYRNSMQELVIFKSKADAELIQLSAKVDSAKSELESSRRLYNDLYEQYGGMQKKYEDAKENLMNMHNEKTKIADEIQALSDQSFDENEFQAPLQQVQAEITQLQSQLMLIKQESLQTQQKKQSALTEAQIAKQNLQREIELYQEEIESGRSEADKHQEELINIRNQAQEVLTKATIDKNALSSVLVNCGQIFQALSQAALNCGVEIPSFNLKLDWSASLAQCASDWETDNFADGFTAVEPGTLSASADMASAGASARDEAVLPVLVKEGDSKNSEQQPAELGALNSGSSVQVSDLSAPVGNSENSNPVENTIVESAQQDSDWVSFAS